NNTPHHKTYRSPPAVVLGGLQPFNKKVTVMRPNSSRTGTAQWMRVRDKRREHDFNNGLTNCPECKSWLDWEYSGRPNSAEVDHIIPHARGGQDTFENTQILCRLCNQRSGGKLGGKRRVYNAQRVRYQTVIDW